MNPAKRKKILRLKNVELEQTPSTVMSVVKEKVEVKKESAPVVVQEIQAVQETAPLQETNLEIGLKVADETVATQQVELSKKDKKKKSFTQDV